MTLWSSILITAYYLIFHLGAHLLVLIELMVIIGEGIQAHVHAPLPNVLIHEQGTAKGIGVRLRQGLPYPSSRRGAGAWLWRR